MERKRVSSWHLHFLAGNVIIADNWLIIHNFNRLTNQRAGKVLRHQKVLCHRVAFLKVLNWSDFLILPLPDFAKGCRLFNSLWGFESHCVTWTVMRTWQIKILCTTCAGVRFPFLDFYFPCYPAPTIPLAEVQPKFCIPASGGLLLFWFLSPLEEMHRKLCIPASGNAKRRLHLRFAEMQADVCSTASGTAHKTV